MPRLSGKVAVITGAAAGIGAATARRFHAEGAEVVITDIKTSLGEDVAASCNASFIRQDVSNPESWQEVSAFIKERFGRLDILVNNAAILTNQDIADVDLATWNRVLGINLTGPMLGSQMAIALMRENPAGPGGSIINISSTAAYGAVPGALAYTTSKSAVRMLTKSIAVWCARERLGIRCNSVHPGGIHTTIYEEMLAQADDPKALLAVFSALSPMNRLGTTDEVAAVITFLASDDASWVTGGEYLVDGGTTAVHPGL